MIVMDISFMPGKDNIKQAPSKEPCTVIVFARPSICSWSTVSGACEK